MERKPSGSAEDGDRFDYVIVGAGSAGCVLANRLSEDPSVSVAILEAGGKNDGLLVRMPAGSSRLFNNKNASNWAFETVPQPHLDGRSLFTPRGRGLGGSSAINAMLYVRGHARDYDQWRQMGLAGWGYADVLPYFKRAEHNEDGGDEWHGAGGPLWVSRAPPGNPLYKAFINAGRQAGFPVTRDFNGRQQEGFGPYQMTIKNGARWSAATAYLAPLVGVRPNLSIVPNAHALRVIVERGVAVGVEYSAGPGKPVSTVFAKREVILSAGVFQSAQLLMLSGIGPADHLTQFGIPVEHDAPEVGANLQDHLDIGVIYECTKPITVYSITKGHRQTLVGLEYMLRGTGPARTNHLHSGAFIKTRPELDRPDVQLHFVNAVMVDHGRVKADRDGFTMHAYPCRPESRGEVRLASRDPFAAPLIDPKYLSAEADRRTMRDSVKILRDVAQQDALRTYRGAEMRPGPDVKTDDEIDSWVRRTAETLYHPVGTVRMGADEKAPVDAELRVRGVQGLRVVDCSIMPTLIGGNTNAPAMMIAEKAADIIRGRAPLPAEHAPIAEDALKEAV